MRNAARRQDVIDIAKALAPDAAEQATMSDARKWGAGEQAWKDAKRQEAEENRIARRLSADTDVGYARIKAARAKRAARKARRLATLAL